ncbi:MAG: SpoIIE family protein phosphatase [Acidobacteriota bacterium]
MDTVTDTFLREQLNERRQRLQQVLDRSTGSSHLMGLLKEVDAALERMNDGSYGLCEVCHDPIEKDRLMANPLVCYCIDHLTAAQQKALEQDLELASRVQGGLLPKSDFRCPDWDIAFFYRPAGAVSGDYCDLLNTPDGGFIFLLGDVSGKGVAASMRVAQLHATFRTLVLAGLSVAELVNRANRLFCESTLADSYATLIAGKGYPDGMIEICNAGHCPPLVVRSGQVSECQATGLPIGIFCEGEYFSNRQQLTGGDTLVLYTDGVSEARDANGREYGTGALWKVAEKQHRRPARQLIDLYLQDLAAFQSGHPLTDDLTLLVIHKA